MVKNFIQHPLCENTAKKLEGAGKAGMVDLSCCILGMAKEPAIPKHQQKHEGKKFGNHQD